MTTAAGRILDLGPWALLAAGLLSAGLSYCTVAGNRGVSGPGGAEAGLQDRLDGLRDATPGNLAEVEARLRTALARLPEAGSFDPWMRTWNRDWAVESRTSETDGDIEIRRYVLACDHPGLDRWPQITADLDALCGEAGLSIDTLDLSAGPDGTDSFRDVRMAFTVRLRP